MRICRFDDGRVGLVDGDVVRDVTAAVGALPDVRWPIPTGDMFIANLDSLREPMMKAAASAVPRPLRDVTLLSPVANPGKIVGAPVNYKLHLDEARDDKGIHFGSPVKSIAEAGVFLKAASSLVGPGEGVIVDWDERRTDHEVELAVVIGREGFRISEEDAMSYVAGYAIGLDMTIRGPEERSYRKSLDTFSVLGPWLVTADELEDPHALELALSVNGEIRQHSNTRHLIFGIRKLIAYASKAYTLHPGDIIMTGTPDGVAPVVPGDIIHARIERIGEMDVRVR